MSNNRNLLKRSAAFIQRKLLGAITNVSTSRRAASLTFDDGPNPNFTPRLLKLLNEYGAKATFFVVGKQAARYPELIKSTISAGHAIGNHSWDHSSFPLLTAKYRKGQLLACSRVLAPYKPALFRPPYGHLNLLSKLDVRLLGYKIIMWSIVAEDWLDHSAQTMAEKVINEIQPGGIILFHDSLYTVMDAKYADRQPTLDAVRIVLNKLNGQYDFITVPELLKLGKHQKTNWYSQPDTQWLKQLKKGDIADDQRNRHFSNYCHA